MPEFNYKSLIIKIVAISLCVAGFIYDIKGANNLHILYCILLVVGTFLSIVLLSIPEAVGVAFKNKPKLLEKEFKWNNINHIISQIFVGVQVLLCGYYGAWGRVILLILSSIFIFIINAKAEEIYKEYIGKMKKEVNSPHILKTGDPSESQYKFN